MTPTVWNQTPQTAAHPRIPIENQMEKLERSREALDNQLMGLEESMQRSVAALTRRAFDFFEDPINLQRISDPVIGNDFQLYDKDSAINLVVGGHRGAAGGQHRAGSPLAGARRVGARAREPRDASPLESARGARRSGRAKRSPRWSRAPGSSA